MKNLIKISLICFIGTILMTSCNSNFSITKRHYTKGYYVDNVKSKHTKVVEENDKLSRSNGNESHNVDQDQELNSATMKNSDQQPINNNNIVVNSSKNENTEAKSSQLSSENEIGSSELSVDPITTVKNSYKKLKYAKAGAKQGEGLSLFWIIILVILILWLFGVISTGFAIGSIINLLLLVALILLILWLLRII